jgi:hypothetical protein
VKAEVALLLFGADERDALRDADREAVGRPSK